MASLFESALGGSREAFERLIAYYLPTIQQECYAYQTITSPDLSHADLVQEVSLRVWAKITQFRGIKKTNEEPLESLMFEAWLRKTARSVLNNLYRERNTKKRKPATPMQSFDANQEALHVSQQGPTASSIVSQAEECLRVRNALLEKLEGLSRDIVLLHINDNLSFQEIAEQLKLTYDQVRHRYRAALKHLENELSN